MNFTFDIDKAIAATGYVDPFVVIEIVRSTPQSLRQKAIERLRTVSAFGGLIDTIDNINSPVAIEYLRALLPNSNQPASAATSAP
jgi:hypothetical protein